MSLREDAIFTQVRATGDDSSLYPKVTIVKGLYKFSQSLDVASVAANTSAEQTFTVTGLKAGDIVVSVNVPATLNDGLGLVGHRVSAANTLALRFQNSTAGALDPAAATYEIVVYRPGADL